MAPNSPGWEYAATLQLDIEDSLVTGSNLWKVVESPYEWAGKTAKEFLAGTYNAETRALEVSGTSKDDPESIIALDSSDIYGKLIATHPRT